MTDSERRCINPYGSEAGPHTGPADYVAVLYTADRPEGVSHIGPLCEGHARYEQMRRDAMNMISKARVEPAPPAKPE
jgi:hypothetical protein